MKTQDLREEKNDSQPDATPLAAAAHSLMTGLNALIIVIMIIMAVSISWQK